MVDSRLRWRIVLRNGWGCTRLWWRIVLRTSWVCPCHRRQYRSRGQISTRCDMNSWRGVMLLRDLIRPWVTIPIRSLVIVVAINFVHNQTQVRALTPSVAIHACLLRYSRIQRLLDLSRRVQHIQLRKWGKSQLRGLHRRWHRPMLRCSIR